MVAALACDREPVELPAQAGREVADVDDLLNFTAAFLANLAGLVAHERAEVVLVLAELEADAAHELAAPGRGLRAPAPEALGGGGDDGGDVLGRGEGKLGERRAIDRAAASRAGSGSRSPLGADGNGAWHRSDAEAIENVANRSSTAAHAGPPLVREAFA
jgi:hypothetical protein